ncbi:hypothetical protein WJX73_006546 [Symbiochloris irregularis]|uniref:C2 domain-containing protein n=1 Tax=Symbiochloris irregularis TaxID=706552 RepID=A0AAW1NM78_9CHLO
MTGLRDRMRRVREKVGHHHKHDKEAAEAVDLSQTSVHSADSVAFTETDTASMLTDIGGSPTDEDMGIVEDDHRYVRVILYSARRLLVKDSGGYSDPYVEGKLGEEKFRSRIVQQTTWPNWNQEFVAKMAQSENQEDHVLKLTAWDYDGPHRSPDFLGQVRVPLADLINSQPEVKATDKTWYQLTPKVGSKAKVQGDMCVGLEFITAAQARQIQVTLGQGGDATSTAKYAAYSLALCIHGIRGTVSTLTSGVRYGLFVEARVGSYATKTTTLKEVSKEDEFELAWEKQVLVHMDDAMRVPKTKGVYNTVAHHFYESAYEQLRRHGAFDEIRIILKREKSAPKKGKSRGVNIVGIAHLPLSQVPVVEPPREDDSASANGEAEAQVGDAEQKRSLADSVSALSHSMSEAASRALTPIMSAMHHKTISDAQAPIGADTEVKVEPVDESKDVVAQATEQKFWLPLERTGGRGAGEICLSLLLTPVAEGEAVVVSDDDAAADDPNAPDPAPLSLPDPIGETFVDEELPTTTKALWKLLLGADSEFTSKFYQTRKYWDVNVGQWTAKDGQRTKQVEYTMPLKKQPMGPTEAYCIEQYNVISKEPGGWVVDIHVETPKVPYGTAFHSNVQWACQFTGKGKCKVRVSGEVDFTKSCFVKGIVTKATQEGMREAYATFMDVLRTQLGAATPISTATVVQKVANVNESVHSRINLVQALLFAVVAVLVFVIIELWRLDSHTRVQTQLLQRLSSLQ